MANGHFTVQIENGLPYWNDPDGCILVPHGFTVNAQGTVFNPPSNTPSGGLTTPNIRKLQDNYCFGGLRLWWASNEAHKDDRCTDGQHPGGRGDGKFTQYPNDTLLQVANECANRKVLCLVTLLVGGHGNHLTGSDCGGVYPDGSGRTFKQVWQQNVNNIPAAIKTNPWVMFQPIVEPGSSADNTDEALWVSEHQFTINYLRGQGFQNWILPDGFNWGSDRGNPRKPWEPQGGCHNPGVLHKGGNSPYGGQGYGDLTDPLNRLGKTAETYLWGGGPNRAWRRQQLNKMLNANFAAHPNAPLICSDWDVAGNTNWPLPDYGVTNGTCQGDNGVALPGSPGGESWSYIPAGAETWLLEVRDNFPNVGLMQWHGNGGQGYGGAHVTNGSSPNPQGDWANYPNSSLRPVMEAWRQIASNSGLNRCNECNPFSTIVDPDPATCGPTSYPNQFENSSWAIDLPAGQTYSYVSGDGEIQNGQWTGDDTSGGGNPGFKTITYRACPIGVASTSNLCRECTTTFNVVPENTQPSGATASHLIL